MVGSNIFNIFLCVRHQCNHKASTFSVRKQPRHRCRNFFEYAAVFIYVHGEKAFIGQMGGVNFPHVLWGFRRLSSFHGLRMIPSTRVASATLTTIRAKSSSDRGDLMEFLALLIVIDPSSNLKIKIDKFGKTFQK